MKSAPLTSYQAVREHLDLVVGPDERAQSSVYVVLCDEAGRPLTNAAVDDLPDEASLEDCARTVEPFAMALGGSDFRGGMLVAVTRPGPSHIGDVDRRWFAATHAVCARFDVSVLGIYILTTRDTREVHLDDAA